MKVRGQSLAGSKVNLSKELLFGRCPPPVEWAMPDRLNNTELCGLGFELDFKVLDCSVSMGSGVIGNVLLKLSVLACAEVVGV